MSGPPAEQWPPILDGIERVVSGKLDIELTRKHILDISLNEAEWRQLALTLLTHIAALNESLERSAKAETILQEDVERLDNSLKNCSKAYDGMEFAYGELEERCAFVEPIIEAAEKVNWRCIIDALNEYNLAPLATMYVEDLFNALSE